MAAASVGDVDRSVCLDDDLVALDLEPQGVDLGLPVEGGRQVVPVDVRVEVVDLVRRELRLVGEYVDLGSLGL